jgi:RNA polymerase sigma-70 factor (ECF subfamily)
VNLSEHEVQKVNEAMAGSEEAFAFLVKQFSRLVYAQAFALLGDSQEAEDVTQECFLRAFRFRVGLQDPAKFPQWLLTIARNLARDHFRRRHATQSLDEPSQAELPDEQASPPLRAIDRQERCTEVTTALAELPPRYRNALTLRYLCGLDYRTICQRLGLTDGALRGVLGRALARLRKALNHEDPGR